VARRWASFRITVATLDLTPNHSKLSRQTAGYFLHDKPDPLLALSAVKFRLSSQAIDTIIYFGSGRSTPCLAGALCPNG
jgi:hypothetical protein